MEIKQNRQIKKRLFLAINLPENIKQKILLLITDNSKPNNQTAVSWVKPEGLHITLHFIGYADEETTKNIDQAMSRLAGKFGQMKFKTGEINVFPDLKNPRVIFLECCQTNGNTVCELQKSTGEILQNLNIEFDRRTWISHITMARVKKKCELNLRKDAYPLEFSANSFELMESRLTPQGSEYEILSSYRL